MPVVSDVSGPVAGSYSSADSLEFVVRFSGNINNVVNSDVQNLGAPTYLILALDSGIAYAQFKSFSGAELTFSYSPSAKDFTFSGIAVMGFQNLKATNSAGEIARLVLNKNYTFPTVNIVHGNSANLPSFDAYLPGDTLTYTLRWRRIADVVISGGTPQLAITVGDNEHLINAEATNQGEIAFNYIVKESDLDTDGVAIGALNLNNATIIGKLNELDDKSFGSHQLTVTSTAFINNGFHKVKKLSDNSSTVLVGRSAVPQVTKVDVPSSGDYLIGATISFSVHFDQAVWARNSATTKLNILLDNERVVQASYVSAPGAQTSWQFDYVVTENDKATNGIQLLDLTSNASFFDEGPTYEFSDWRDLVLQNIADSSAITINSANIVNIISVSAPIAKTYVAGDKLSFTLNYSDIVFVTGSPLVYITIGGTQVVAKYISGSGTSSLTFSYIVEDRLEDVNGITIDAFVLNGATIVSSNAIIAEHALNNIADTSNILVESGAKVLSVELPEDKTYGYADTLSFIVNFDEMVNVTGTPVLSILIGSSNQSAHYVSGSGSGRLIFEYQVNAEDIDDNGIEVNRLQEQGAKILNIKKLLGDLTLKNISSGEGVFVDGGAPKGYLVRFDQSLLDNDNKTALSFTLSDAPIGSFYNYRLTMANGVPGMITGNGTVLQSSQQIGLIDSSSLPDGDVILSLSLSFISASDSASQGDVVTDNIAKYTLIPIISSVDVPIATFYGAAAKLQFSVNFSEPVIVVGAPQIAININGSEVFASYDKPLSNSNKLVFSYLIASPNTLEDLNGIEISTIDLNGGGIFDLLNNPVDLTYQNVGDLTGVLLVTTSVNNLQSVVSSAAGVYYTGDTLHVYLAELNGATSGFGFPLDIVGNPEIVLALDSGDVTAQYVASSDAGIHFEYIIQASDSHNTDNALKVKSLSIPSGSTIGAFAGMFNYNTIVDRISDFTGVNINHVNTSKVTSVQSTTLGVLTTNDSVDIKVFFSSIVDVSGVPQLVLNIGGETAYADYISGDNTTELTFQYTVQPDDNDSDGISISTLQLNNGLINDSAATPADLTLNNISQRNAQIDNSGPFGFSLDIANAITALTADSFIFSFVSAELAALYEISISQNGNTSIVQTGTIYDSRQVIRGVDFSSYADAQLTLSVKLTDSLGNVSTTYHHIMQKDSTAPSLQSILRHSPTAITTDADILTWRLTFDEAIQLPDINNFSLTNSSAQLTLTAVSGEPNKIDITATGGDITHKIGEIEINLAPLSTIIDLAGNLLSSSLAMGEQQTTYILDNAILITIIPPSDITLDATGLLTKVDIGHASAADQFANEYQVERLEKSSYFKPGLHTVTWQVTLSTGEVFKAQQQIAVNPLVTISQDANALSGQSYTAVMHLNGPAIAYPLFVSYEMFDRTGEHLESWRASIASGTTAEIFIDGYFTEYYEQLVIKLDPSLNLGNKSSFILNSVTDNISPELNLTIQQAGETRYQITSNTDPVSIKANALNVTASDVYSVEWSSEHNELVNISHDDLQYQFNPNSLLSKVYKVTATLTKDAIVRTQNIFFEVIAEQSVLTDQDTDGDLLLDNNEGYLDTDKDGLANYVDAISDLSNVMPHKLSDSAPYLLETDAGTRLTLGQYSLQDTNYGVLISDELLQRNIIATDSDAENVGGLFNFEVHDLTISGTSVAIVIPLREKIPENMILRHLNANDDWLNFVIDDKNKLYSAPGENGYCPEQGSSSYTEGLTAGNWCVRLVIEDGGNNDGDGLVNGMLSLLAGIAIYQPKIIEVSALPTNGTYKINDNIEINVKFNQPISVIGEPTLLLETGSVDREAIYISGSDSDTLTFNYRVQPGDNTSDLAYLSKNSLAVYVGSIVSVNTGYSAILTLPNPGAIHSLSANANLIVDGILPTASDINLSITGGDPSHGYKAGDTIVVTWNNSAAGDNNVDINNVVFDLSMFGGTHINATQNNGVWTASYIITDGLLDLSDANVAITVTDTAGNSIELIDSSNANVDNQAPIISARHIIATGATGNNGIYKLGDTLTVHWNNSVSGENIASNSDISLVAVDFSQLGGSLVTATNIADVWTASYKVMENTVSGELLSVAISASDDATNNRYKQADQLLVVDALKANITATNIQIIGSNLETDYRVGDIITATWDNSVLGDNNDDIASVEFNFSAFGIGHVAAVVNNNVWTAEHRVVAGEINIDQQSLPMTVFDLAGNESSAESEITFSINSFAPFIELQAEVWIDATGLYTRVARPDASANDFNDEQVTLVITDQYGESPKLVPGSYQFTYSARNAFGNETIKSQTVNIRPIVSFAQDQIALKGSAVSARVILNGNSPVYPLIVLYRLTEGSVSDNDFIDGQLIFTEGQLEGLITLNVLDDAEVEGAEELNIELVPSTNVNLGNNFQHKITIREGNLAPEVIIQATQNGDAKTWFVENSNSVSIIATVKDANINDQHSYSWQLSNELNVFSSNSASLDIDTNLLAAGAYSLSLTVYDNGQPPLSDSSLFSFLIKAELPQLDPILDSDNDGINDLLEGFTDSDNDGIPNYLDNALLPANVLTHKTQDGGKYLLESEAGTRITLGILSLQGEAGGVLLPDVLLADNALFEVDNRINVGGYFDFEIHDLPIIGQSVDMVLPLRDAIPNNAKYRKHTVGMGWADFIINENNALYSAPGENGYCPYPGSDQYKVGLNAGDWCLRLTIEDGGLNDADQLANGMVVDPGGVSIEKIEVSIEEPINNNNTISNSSGGGSTGLFSLLSMLLFLLCRYMKYLLILMLPILRVIAAR